MCSPKIRNRGSMSILPLLFNIILKIVATQIRQEDNKINIDWRGRDKIFLSGHTMVVYIEDFSNATKKRKKEKTLLSRLHDTKNNKQKVFTFLYTNNEHEESKWKTTLFKITPKKMNYMYEGLSRKYPAM